MHFYILGAILGIWNLIVLLLYGFDKRAAKKHRQRVSEKTLILCSFLGGGIGAAFGMLLFHHKTKHIKFQVCVPLAVLLNVVVFGAVFWFVI